MKTTMKNRARLVSMMLVIALLAVSCLFGASAEETYDPDATIVWGMTSAWADLTPFSNSAGGYYQGIIADKLYDRLVYVGNDGTLVPRAAESWEMSADGLSLTFHLNSNSLFHDGTPVTAADWVWTMQMLSDPECGFVDQSLISMIEGTDNAGVELSENSIGIEATDDYTLVFHFKNVVNETSFLISDSYVFRVLPKHLLEDIPMSEIATCDFWNAPIGSGPCKFVSQIAGSELVLERFTDYYLGDAQWSKMVFRVMANSALATALMTGEIDIPYVSLSTEEALELEGTDGLYVGKTASATALWMICLDNAKLTDVRVRQAINYAIDKEIIGTQLLLGMGEPMESFLPFGNEYVPDTIAYGQDKEKAAELLAAAVADGYDPTFVLATPAGTRERMAALIEQDLESVGFTVEVQVLEAATMFAELRKGVDSAYDAGIVGYGISPDPMFMNPLLDYTKVSFLNTSDPTFLDYQQKIAAEQDVDARLQLIYEYQEYIYSQQPAIWLIASYSYQVYTSRLGDVSSSLLDISFRNSDVWNWKVTK